MSDNDKNLLKEFNYNNSISDAEIDLNVTAPADEPDGIKSSTITVTIS